jgi:UrcA family protein
MTNPSAHIAVAAMTFAVLPATAFAETRVRVSDVDFATAQGQATYDQRSRSAAGAYCARYTGLAAQASCKKGVMAELKDKGAIVQAERREKAAKAYAIR